MNTSSIDNGTLPMRSDHAYRADIDGLRAVAVLIVIAHHLGLATTGGFVGVDVFFVISGYLITQIIVREHVARTFSLVKFFERRIRRIAPLLLVVLATVWGAGYLLLLPGDFAELCTSINAQLLMVGNVQAWRSTGYFAQAAREKPLLHLWSLSVEEQFYLLWPLAIGAALRCGLRFAQCVTSLLLATSFGLCVLASYNWPSANYFLLPTRAWELLCGCLFGLVQSSSTASDGRRAIMASTGMGFIALAATLLDEHSRFPGILALLPVVGAGMVLRGGERGYSLPSRLLATWPLPSIGRVSYGLYLWHWPPIAFLQYWGVKSGDALVASAVVAATFLLSYGSYWIVETPIRRKSLFASPVALASFTFASATLMMALSLVAIYDGFPGRISGGALRVVAASREPIPPEVNLSDVRAGRFTELNTQMQTGHPYALIWGDSHAGAMFPAFTELAARNGVRAIAATHSATAPLLGFESTDEWSLRADSVEFGQEVVRYAIQANVQHVVLCAYWGKYVVEGREGEFAKSLERTVDSLASAGIRVWIVSQVADYEFDVPRALGRAAIFGEASRPKTKTFEQHSNETRKQRQSLASAEQKGAVVLDPNAVLQDAEGNMLLSDSDGPLYRDSNHLSRRGAARLVSVFEPVFNAKTPRGPSARALLQR